MAGPTNLMSNILSSLIICLRAEGFLINMGRGTRLKNQMKISKMNPRIKHKYMKFKIGMIICKDMVGGMMQVFSFM